MKEKQNFMVKEFNNQQINNQINNKNKSGSNHNLFKKETSENEGFKKPFYKEKNNFHKKENTVKTKHVLNKDVQAKEVRVDGVVMSLKEALNKAQEQGVDLIEINSSITPVICKIMDYGKFLYENKKKEQENAKKQSKLNAQVKEIKFRPVIDNNDLKIKIKNCEKFLTSGNKVKLFMIFKGREMAHQTIGIEVLIKVIESLKSLGNLEQGDVKIFEKLKNDPKTNNNRAITLTLVPKK